MANPVLDSKLAPLKSIHSLSETTIGEPGNERQALEGALPSGRRYQLTLSRRGAVERGAHIIVTVPGTDHRDELSLEDSRAIIQTALTVARDLPMASEHGASIAMNFHSLRRVKEFHLHLIVPGDAAEAAAAPDQTAKWWSGSDAALPSEVFSDKAIALCQVIHPFSISGREVTVRIRRDAAIALHDGIHFSLSLAGAEPNAEEQKELIVYAMKLARESSLAFRFGARVGVYLGKLRKEGTLDVHVLIPGSDAEREAAPQYVKRWGGH